MNKVLITGATGYLGRRLVKSLLTDSGYKVIVIVRECSDLSIFQNYLESIEIYDNKSLDALFTKHKNISTFIHAATCYGRNEESDQEILRANTLFPLSIIDYLKHNEIKCNVINIDTVLPRKFNLYALSKKQFLDWLKHYASKKYIRVSNVELNYMYGEYDASNKFTSFIINKCIENFPIIKLTKGSQKKDFIYIDDVVSAIIAIMKVNHNYDFYNYELGCGKAVALKDYVKLVYKLTKSKSKLDFGAIPTRDGEIDDKVADISSLMNLGWSPQFSLEEGLSKTIKKELAK